MSRLSKYMDQIAEAIRNINPYANPTVRIQNPSVGLRVGTCRNCNNPVSIRQPWLSRLEVVNDGWYLIHCECEDCHNYYGMELKDNQFDLADFVDWDEKNLIINQEDVSLETNNIIQFRGIV